MPQTQTQLTADIAIVERRRESRIIVIPARYALAKRYDANGNRHEWACRIVKISLHEMTLFAPVNGAIGDWVIAHWDEFGKLEGSIIRVHPGGFGMTIAATDEELAKLAVKIEWHHKNKNHGLPDNRTHRRIVPNDPRSTLFFADNSRRKCFIIDISASGAAVSAEIKPDIGTPLAVGKIVGRVVRHFPTGFAVQFIQLQNLDSLEQKLILS